MTGAMDDDVSVDELRQAVEHLHGVPATFIEAVEVDERFNGEVVWQGAVKVFALIGHPSGATRVYAWSYRTEGTRRLTDDAMVLIVPTGSPASCPRGPAPRSAPGRSSSHSAPTGRRAPGR